MDGHDSDVMAGCPDRWSGSIPVGTPDPGGSKMCKNGDFGKNPQIWPKMAKLAKMAKTGIFGKTPKMTQKTVFFRECENASSGALTCDETRRIIYCLDTRYGPQNGGFGPPRGVGRFTRNTRNRENANFAHFGENRVFRCFRKTEYPDRIGRWSRRGPG
jgi:hypothetical protein